MLYLLRIDGLLGVVFVSVSAEWEAVDFSVSVEWEVVDLGRGLCFWGWVEEGGSHYSVTQFGAILQVHFT
jgi:hypothetical protein